MAFGFGVEVDYEGLARRANLLYNTAVPIVNNVLSAYDKFNNDMKESWKGYSYDELIKMWNQTIESMYKCMFFITYSGPNELYLKAAQYAKRDHQTLSVSFEADTPPKISELTLTNYAPKLRFFPNDVQNIIDEISGDLTDAHIGVYETYQGLVKDTKSDWESAGCDATCNALISTCGTVAEMLHSMNESFKGVAEWQKDMIEKNEQANMEVKAGRDISEHDATVPEALFNTWRNQFEPWSSWADSFNEYHS